MKAAPDEKATPRPLSGHQRARKCGYTPETCENHRSQVRLAAYPGASPPTPEEIPWRNKSPSSST